MKKLTLLLIMSIPAGIAAAQDLTVCASKSYTLTSDIDAVGEGLVTYEWLENNLPVPDSNSPTLTVAAGHAAGDFAYVRMAANAACTVSSNAYTVRVNPIPTIVLNSGTASQSVNLGTAITDMVYSTTYSAVITGSGLPAGVNGIPSGTPTGTSYTISGTPSATGTFGYSLTAAVGSCTSAAAVGTITVNAAATTPPDAASETTWIFGDRTWSDRIVAKPSSCTLTTSLETSYFPSAQYRYNDGNGRYYYNRPCVYASTFTLCPSPWRVPNYADYAALYANTGVGTLAAAWENAGGYARAAIFENTATGYYASLYASSDSYWYSITYGTGTVFLNEFRADYAFQVRCVKDGW